MYNIYHLDCLNVALVEIALKYLSNFAYLTQLYLGLSFDQVHSGKSLIKQFFNSRHLWIVFQTCLLLKMHLGLVIAYVLISFSLRICRNRLFLTLKKNQMLIIHILQIVKIVNMRDYEKEIYPSVTCLISIEQNNSPFTIKLLQYFYRVHA